MSPLCEPTKHIAKKTVTENCDIFASYIIAYKSCCFLILVIDKLDTNCHSMGFLVSHFLSIGEVNLNNFVWECSGTIDLH